ncbi:hypothetical protein SALBM135S_05964 [Streptomyces alboniger]
MVVGHAEGAHGVPLALARGGEDLRTEVPGELYGGHAHAARGGVHEDRLAGAEAAHVDQAVVGGGERHGDGRRLFVGPAVGHRHDRVRVGHADRSEAAG